MFAKDVQPVSHGNYQVSRFLWSCEIGVGAALSCETFKQVGMVLISESRGIDLYVRSGLNSHYFPYKRGFRQGFIYPPNKDSLLKVG